MYSHWLRRMWKLAVFALLCCSNLGINCRLCTFDKFKIAFEFFWLATFLRNQLHVGGKQASGGSTLALKQVWASPVLPETSLRSASDKYNSYRPQRSWGKVIFSEACVKNSVHRVGVCPIACWDTPPGADPPPPDQIQVPPGTRYRHPTTHPTRMQSCLCFVFFFDKKTFRGSFLLLQMTTQKKGVNLPGPIFRHSGRNVRGEPEQHPVHWGVPFPV